MFHILQTNPILSRFTYAPFRHQLTPLRCREAVCMASAMQAGHRNSPGNPLCLLMRLHTKVFIAAGAFQSSGSIWESKHRGKAPASHAGMPPSTGKSALSASEEAPTAPSFTCSEKQEAPIILSHPGGRNLRGTQV